VTGDRYRIEGGHNRDSMDDVSQNGEVASEGDVDYFAFAGAYI
jgi:hypothetical protein